MSMPDSSSMAGDQPLISVVMPCLNEELTLATCIRKAQRSFAEMGVKGEVIIADNGSSDRSVDIARECGAQVVHQSVRGYGAALMKGIEAAHGRYVVMGDADDSYDWHGIAPFIERLEQGFDLVVGNRFKGGIAAGAMPPLHRYLGNPVLSWIARAVHRAPVGDFHCGMRAFRRDAYDRMRMRTPGMEFATEMIVNAAKVKLRIAEVPTTLAKDGRDRPPHLRSFRDGWRHLRFILTYGPNYLYLTPGAALFSLGLALVALLAGGPITLAGRYFGIHFLALGSLLTLVGFNILNLGVFAKVIALQQSPGSQSRMTRWALSGFTLEAGLVIGLALTAIGAVIDLALLYRWLEAPGLQMENSVHVGFVATLVIVLGINLVFSSFLLSMLVTEEQERGRYGTEATKK
ncbi:MAG: glycosyltransferase family 2 protein [Gammaproteobacteria bacterium]|nr:glycosyltransferase family 2 protein [Gammaproteobacteria bacterium]